MKNEKDGSRLGIIILVAGSLVFIGLASVGVIFISAKLKENEAAKVEKARQNRQALGALTAVTDQINQDLRDKIGKEDAVEGSADKAKQIEEAMGKAASKATGDDAKAMLAGQRLMASMQLYIAAYEKAYSAFMAKGGMSPASVTSHDDLNDRLALLKTFQTANQDFLENLKSVEVTYRTELLKQNVPLARAGTMARQFCLGGNIDTIISIRGTDNELCALMGQGLQLLQREWGKWKVNEEGVTVFQNTSALKSFQDLQSQIKEVANRQMQLQQNLQPKPARPDAAKLLQGRQ